MADRNGHRGESWAQKHLATVLLATILLLQLIGGAFAIKSNHDDAIQGQQIAESSQRSSTKSATNLHDNCVRGNKSRADQLELYDRLLAGNRRRRNAWRFYRDRIAVPGQTVTGAPVEAFANRQIGANQAEIDGLKIARRHYATHSTKAVSKHPHSSNPHRRAVAACGQYYPLPDES